MKLAAQGRYDEALALIKRENPLPAICGRVCNRRCEDACTRGRVDAAVAIDEVKKFIAQRGSGCRDPLCPARGDADARWRLRPEDRHYRCRSGRPVLRFLWPRRATSPSCSRRTSARAACSPMAFPALSCRRTLSRPRSRLFA
ncbi:MAG: hypothetical protein ACLU0O_09045 [Collinsella sp.]